MAVWVLPAIMAAYGLGKHFLSDAPREKRQRKLAAQKTLYSPWTGRSGQAPQEADLFGTVSQSALSGLAMGQNIESANAYKAALEKMAGGAGGATPGGAPPVIPAPPASQYSPYQEFAPGGMNYFGHRMNPWQYSMTNWG